MAQRSLIQERRNRIIRYINENRKADIRQLAELLGESEITIRRDLIELEKAKKLIRVHGGAILNEQKKSVWQTSSIYNRLERNREDKERIARMAATLIHNDESLFIDGGSSNQILAPLIRDLPTGVDCTSRVGDHGKYLFVLNGNPHSVTVNLPGGVRAENGEPVCGLTELQAWEALIVRTNDQ